VNIIIIAFLKAKQGKDKQQQNKKKKKKSFNGLYLFIWNTPREPRLSKNDIDYLRFIFYLLFFNYVCIEIFKL